MHAAGVGGGLEDPAFRSFFAGAAGETAFRPRVADAQLMAEMTNRRIRHFPVVQDGRLCGIVSIGDLVKNRLDEVEYEARSLRSFIAGA